jgi:hypothetical protein
MEENNHKSWAEMVKSLENEKKTLPWDSSKVSPVQRINLFEVFSISFDTMLC